MIGLAITCFEDPDRCASLLKDLRLLGALDGRDCWLSDQSILWDSQAHYRAIAEEYGVTHIPYPQEGATGAKKQVLQMAHDKGMEFCHQMSEDFEVNWNHGAVVAGTRVFLQDSELLIQKRPELDFVKHCILTPPDGDMQYLYFQPWGNLKFEVDSGVTLPFLTGDIVYSNWPAIWRVKRIVEMWQHAQSWVPKTPDDHERMRISGGEWAASMCRYAKGAVLLAQPLIHARRCHTRPEGSIS